MKMNSSLLLSAIALLALSLPVTASFAKTKTECEEMYNRADTDGDGSIAQMEDPKWEQRILHMTEITKKDQTIISKEQFMTSCLRGEMDGM